MSTAFSRDYQERFGGVARLLGRDGLARLHAAHVCVVGAIRTGDLGESMTDDLRRLVRRKLRRDHGFARGEGRRHGVRCVYSAEKPVYPWVQLEVMGNGSGERTRPACRLGRPAQALSLAIFASLQDRRPAGRRTRHARRVCSPEIVRTIPSLPIAPIYPWSDGTCSTEPEPGGSLRLDCESGFGTAVFVTGAFGLAAAGEAVRVIAGLPRNGTAAWV